MAFFRQQRCETLARHFVLIITEKGFSRFVERQDQPISVKNRDAIGRGVQDCIKLAQLAVAMAHFSLKRANARRQICFQCLAKRHQ